MALLAVLMLSVSVGAAADIYPDEETGAYNFTYTSASASTDYVVLVLDGIYGDGEAPVITKDSVYYFNQISSDAQGKIELSFVPSEYADSTLFLSANDSSEPFIACYLRKGEAESFVDFDITVENNSVTVDGSGNTQYIRFAVTAYDSFGFETEITETPEFAFVDYSGDRIRFTRDYAISVSSLAQAGSYTFSVTVGEITKTASFDVIRTVPVAKELLITVNGTASTREKHINCFTDISGSLFSPESLLFKAETFDQYGEELDDMYDFTLSKTGENNTLTEIETCTDESTYTFIPTATPDYGESLKYVLSVKSRENASLFQSINIIIVGHVDYTGYALDLYLDLLSARATADEIGTSIIISNDGRDVDSGKKWVRATYAETFLAALDSAENMLGDISKGIYAMDASRVSYEDTSLRNALTTFTKQLSNGTYRPITGLSFDVLDYYVIKGRIATIAASTTPDRPSEKVVYSSEDESIAKVDQSGRITALSDGTVKITAKNPSGSVETYYNLIVYTPISSLSFPSSSYTAAVGTTFTPECVTYPLEGEHSDIIFYKSSDNGVAHVDEYGNITTYGEGTARITATTLSGLTAYLDVKTVTPKLSVRSAYTGKGHAATVGVRINDGFDFSSLSLEIGYDDSVLTLRDISDSGILSGYAGAENTGENPLIINYSLSSPAKNVSGNILTIKFDVAGDAENGSYDIEITPILKDGGGNVLSVKSSGGCVTVGDTLYGDVNADGQVDLMDVLRLAKYIDKTDDIISEINSDVNADGTVDSLDLLALSRYFVGQDVVFGEQEV